MRALAGFSLLVCLLPSIGLTRPVEVVKQGNGWTYTRLGNPKDVKTKTHFGIFFGGGGTDVDAAFRWMCKKSGNGDFLVIRATGNNDYNPYIYGLCPAINSVSTLRIETRAGAQDPFVKDTILNSEALFISGGDQANYLDFWQGTPVQDALNALAARGVPIGGTSAGNAVLAHFSFSARHDTITSQQALNDPFTTLITIDDSFLNLSPLLRNIITDDHFVSRDRMGRLVTFLARILNDNGLQTASAIATSDRTAFLMEPDGSGTVVGEGSVYFVRAAVPAEVLRAGTPLTSKGISVHRIETGSTFNIETWTGAGGVIYSIAAVNGSLQSTQVGGSIY